MKKVFMAVYSSVEYYPPTLNALACLTTQFDKVFILSRNVLKLSWKYEKNTETITSGEFIDIRKAEVKPVLWKIMSFLKFTFALWKTLQTQKPQIVILYDVIPTLAYYLARPFLGYKPLLWYHNHDVTELSKTKKYTIAWFAGLAEKAIFKQLDFFSLPAQDRKQYFPLEELKGKYFFIPNVPSKSFYNTFYSPKNAIDKKCKLIFQGTIAKGHGLEEIISYILPNIATNIEFELNFKGLISEEYKEELIYLATINKVADKLVFHGFSAYQDVPKVASQCHIGIAIHRGTDVMNKTLGTSSNKIYEYAAVGLPILLFDNAHFREHLEKFKWAFFTDVSEKSLSNELERIIANYETLSKQAHEDFMNGVNFESYFNPVLEEVMAKLNS